MVNMIKTVDADVLVIFLGGSSLISPDEPLILMSGSDLGLESQFEIFT